MPQRRTLEDVKHEKQVADLAADFAKFMSNHPEREIVVWQRVLAEAQVKLSKWAAQPEPEKAR